jgi:hypothetical protein
MKKITKRNTVTSSFMIAYLVIASGGLLLLFSSSVGLVMGIPPGVIEGDYLFGRTIGIVEDENGKPLWIISGTWKTNLSNQSQVTDNSTVFDASFEMIKPDGTAKHTHTLTDYILTDVSNPNNNSTIFNGTATISMMEAPITEVPVGIQVMNDNIGVISIDPKKTDNHFGTDAVYGIPLEESEYKEKKSQ